MCNTGNQIHNYGFGRIVGLTQANSRILIIVVVAILLLTATTVLYAQGAAKPPAPRLASDYEQRSVVISWDSRPPGSNVTWEVWVWAEQAGWTRLDDGTLAVERFEHTGLELGVEYWYTYRVVFSNGEGGPFSHYGNVVLSDASPSFSAPTVTAQLIGEDINIKWSEVPGTVNYRFACWCGAGRWEIVDAWETRETNYGPLRPSLTYYFAVQAVNEAGDSTAWSEYAIVTTPAVIPTRTPVPDPTATPTMTPVPSSAYDTWLHGITIAPSSHCSYLLYGEYGFSDRSESAENLRQQIVASMDGRFYDPYLGQYFGDDNAMQINHVVDILEAHLSGMCHASRKSIRLTFVYDLENAVLTSSRLTGHSDAYDLAGWLPELNKCWYANQVVHIKRKYGLTMDTAEADAAIAVLSRCSSTDMIFSNSPTPTPTVVTNDPLQMYDDDGNGHVSCDEARHHGIAPVHSVHPAFQYMSDPDGNGIVCE